MAEPVRLTRYARGGGCACKIPPGELEAMVAGLGPAAGAADLLVGRAGAADLLVGLEHGDDAAVVRLDEHTGVVTTADFFTPVVDDAYDWGRIAATNALSDVYAMGGSPLVALNLLCWPREVLPLELAREVLRGGRDVAGDAGCHLAGGHSVDDDGPKYGLAVTGLVRPAELITLDAGRAGLPLSLTKPLGVGVLNTRHKTTGESFPEAVAAMTTLNRDAARAAVAAGVRCGTDVTGFGLLGHASKLARASRLTVAIDIARVPYLAGAREAVRDGYVSGGSRRNLEWVTPWTDFGAAGEADRLLLADAQTSGGLLVAGEIPGAPVIGELLPEGEHRLVLR
ncbi:selenophosphate synthase [Micromonospora phaseoli]|uniref:Selenide, water dikinase n=1 Tax=Micromonospora phaseoli TaxID=1144548 RepID=A0A1H6RN38_9ACTN|nr:selenide, water dikinase SelD [Micromonospora phaseoli]PZW03580.1 selenophosphate synthase [Micromonospora phaseoli]GIJ77146.1 selenide, water dikinase [Micromonospora phaseoli]SEI57173.1 selenophosphate synthase [Micromonospora phaseoli]